MIKIRNVSIKLKNNYMTLLIWGIVIFFTSLYISLLFSYNIWNDEAFTLQLLKGNLLEMIDQTAQDVHPPLYYLYAKIFTILPGNAYIIQKAAAVIPFTATLVIGATIIRKHFGDPSSFLFLLFITCIPCSMIFAIQARMYSLALLCVTVCGIYAYLAFIDGKKRNFVIFALSGVMAAYIHYFAFVSVIAITGVFLLAILIWRRERLFTWLIVAVGMVVLYAPWMPFLDKQVRSVTSGYWIEEITVETIWTYFTWAFDLNIIPGMVFVFIILLIVVSHYNTILIAKHKNAQDVFALVCMLIPMITALTGVILSWLTTPVYRDQYVFPALGLLALFFGITMRNARKSVLISVSIFLIFVGVCQYKENFTTEYRDTQVPQTIAFLEENVQENDYIMYNWKIYDFIYEAYFPEANLIYLGDYEYAGGKTVWYIHTPIPELLDIDSNMLTEKGLYMDKIDGDFGIMFNSFDIYKIYK